MAWAIAGLVAACLAALVGAGFGWTMWRRRWLIADTPRSDAAHVFVGTNEVVGQVRPVVRPLVAPYTGVECVWYRSVLERERRDEEGRTRWSVVSDESSVAPFWISDDSGQVLVRPKGASVYTAERRRSEHSGAPVRHTGLSLLRTLEGVSMPASSLDRHRTTEWILRPDEAAYLLGEATLREDVVAVEFAPCDPVSGVQRRSLLVSAGDEARAARRTAWQGAALFTLFVAGAAAVPLAWQWFVVERSGGYEVGDPTIWESSRSGVAAVLTVVVAALPVSYVVRVHNRLVATRNRAIAAWSLIDVQLRRRHDLLPLLAETVRGAMAHERDAHEQVAVARTELGLSSVRLPDDSTLQRAEDLDRVDRGRSRELVALVEGHPELRTDENALALLRELVTAEDAVAFARSFYNDAVTVMRDRRERFPGLLLAWAVPVPSLSLWEPEEPGARAASAAPPPVDLGAADPSGGG